MDVSIASGTCTTPCTPRVVGLVGSTTYFSCRSVYSRCTGGARQTPSLRICYISSNVCHALSPLPFVVVFAHVRPWVCSRVFAAAYVSRARVCVSVRAQGNGKVCSRFDPMLAPPSEFVFGGLRIVWISNDCAPSVPAYTTPISTAKWLTVVLLPFLLSTWEWESASFFGNFFFRSIFKRNLHNCIFDLVWKLLRVWNEIQST